MDIAISIASEIGKYSVEPIGRQFGYLIYYDTNIRNLKDELIKLSEIKGGVEGLVNAAKNNGDAIKPEVDGWLGRLKEMIQKARNFEDEVNMKRRCLCRWYLSRKAKKITHKALQLQKEGAFNDVAYPAPAPKIWSTLTTEGLRDFKSRVAVMNTVMEALEKEEIRMIGICGMGGVGKTTMVKQIIKRLEGGNLFDDVVMAVVSQNPNIMKIQLEIVEALRMKIDEKTERGIAIRLRERLMGSKRSLIILDDLWSELDFEAVGLPFGPTHKGCRILFTSRNFELYNALGSQKLSIPIKVLTPEEAWELFQETVGESLGNPDLHTVAQDVANECGGLPIAVVTVGKALNNKRKYEWDSALEQLRKSLPESIGEMDPKVYNSIKLSYDYLSSGEAKSCFLLCCLFREDYDIPIEYLVRYGWGRGMFHNIDTLEQARNRVHSAVEKLSTMFLLLDSNRQECIKMHDVVRDVGISIASKEKHRFLVKCDAESTGWPKEATYEHYTAISLIDVQIDEIPDGLECPKLELLHLQTCKCSESTMDNMFNGMKELKVLALIEISPMRTLSRSLGVLKNLQTLCLEDSRNLGDISSVGGLENLEILSFARSKILALPKEIGHLKKLRLLDTSYCETLNQIPHGLLSSLSRLEELYLTNSFRGWEPAVGSKDKSNASLSEVSSISDHLKVLSIEIPKLNLFSNLRLKSQTTRFQISMDPWRVKGGTYIFENSLLLYGDVEEIMESGTVKFMLKRSVALALTNIEKLKYVINVLDREGFQHLKDLSIDQSSSTEYLVNGTDFTEHTAFPILESLELCNIPNLRAICHGSLLGSSFSNLRSLEIYYCAELKYAFSLSIARNLVHLQSLVVQDCDTMEEIVSKERREHENAARMIAFPKLKELRFSYLFKLVGFYKANRSYSSREITMPKDKDEITEASFDRHGDAGSASMLEAEEVSNFSGILFPSNCISWFQNLEEVRLLESECVEVVFDLKGQQTIPAFPELRDLTIECNSVTRLWTNVPCGVQGFQNLTSLSLESCDKLEYVFSYSIAKVLVNLENVEVCACAVMKTIVRVTKEDEEKEKTGGMILFPKVNKFVLINLPHLESLCTGPCTFVWPSMKTLTLIRCKKLKTLGSVIPPIKQSEDSTAQEAWPTRSGCAPFCSYNIPIIKSNRSTDKKSQKKYSLRENARDFIEILPPTLVKNEETPTSNEDSNADDNLELLQVEECELLEVIFQLQGSHYVQAFNKLRHLVLKSLPMLMHIWENGLQQITITSFGNLTGVEVVKCDKLRYLFPSSIAKLLINLEEIKVENCQTMEEIIAEVEQREEMAFPRVNSITFENLPNLKCFWAKAYTLKLPSLVELKTIECPKFKIFSGGDVCTPSMVRVYTGYEILAEWMGDLNTTIGSIYKGQHSSDFDASATSLASEDTAVR